MSDIKLKSADHKKIIVDLMMSLADKVKPEWITQFNRDQEDANPGSDTIIDLSSYSREKYWKRIKKWTELDENGRIIIFRLFEHVTGIGSVTISEHINDDGDVSLEIEMENVPEPYRKAMMATDEFNVPSLNGPVAKKVVESQPKQSMLDTPKPAGFGAFS